ncbi:MAG: DUF4097 family beta strand repeat protein, partial [Clostridia bacterium]|nr:DUF4097 family beta strand repeat protein [Clostridia bacterium]
TYSLGPVTKIDIQCDTADVALVAAGEGDCKVTCFETLREKYAVDAADGTLVIWPAGNGRSWSLFSFRFKSPKITVYLPAGRYELLQAELHTGDITADRALSFDRVEVELETGDLSFSGVQADRITVRSHTGDLRLSGMKPESADFSVNTGKVTLTDLVCSGDLRVKSSTGDIRLTDVDGANLYLSASTGDIEGTILTDKVFSAHSSTGKVSVPATAAGGRCEAETSTGDIRLSISGK